MECMEFEGAVLRRKETQESWTSEMGYAERWVNEEYEECCEILSIAMLVGMYGDDESRM